MRWARWLAPIVALCIVAVVVALAAARRSHPAEPVPRAAVSAKTLLEPRVVRELQHD